MSAELASMVLIAALAFGGAVYDWHGRRMPDWILLIAAVVALRITALRTDATVFYAVEGLAVSLIAYGVLAFVGAVDSVHVKIMAIIGLVAGPIETLSILFLSLTCGGTTALALALSENRLREADVTRSLVIRHVFRFMPPFRSASERRSDRFVPPLLPHGVMIAIGVTCFGLVNLVRRVY